MVADDGGTARTAHAPWVSTGAAGLDDVATGVCVGGGTLAETQDGNGEDAAVVRWSDRCILQWRVEREARGKVTRLIRRTRSKNTLTWEDSGEPIRTRAADQWTGWSDCYDRQNKCDRMECASSPNRVAKVQAWPNLSDLVVFEDHTTYWLRWSRDKSKLDPAESCAFRNPREGPKVVAGMVAVVVAPVALAAAVVVAVAFGVVMISGEKRNQPESWAFQFHCWGDWY